MSSRMSEGVVRALGLLVFFVGVALVGYVFYQAFLQFQTPVVVPTPAPTPTPAPGVAPAVVPPGLVGEMGYSMVSMVRQMVWLLLMCLAGSVIASLGIKLFFSVRPVPKSPS